jgi:hypothetical protein
MDTTKGILFGALVGALVIGSGACKGSLEPQGPGTGGTTGIFTGTGGSGTGGSPGRSIPLMPSSTGWVQDVVSGVIGPWYSYGDGVGPGAGPNQGADAANSSCQLAGFPPYDCSQINSPPPGMVFPPSDPATGKMCTSGTAAQVLLKDSAPDYADLWGAGIGLNFNEPDPDAGGPGTFDMSSYRGIAFDFSADVLPAYAMRVNFLFKGMHGYDAPYWMGATMSASPLTGTTAYPQHVEIDWPDVGGPFYLMQEVPPVPVPTFDPTAVESIQFLVFTNANTTTPYSFCVANLALVLK